MPVAVSVAMPFYYSSSVKGDTSEESPSLIGDTLGHWGFIGISPRPLMNRRCATWLAVTRQGGFGAVMSLEIFMIVVVVYPTPMTLASGGSPMFPLVVHQPSFSSIWPAMQSLRRGLSTNPGVTMWCVCGCS